MLVPPFKKTLFFNQYYTSKESIFHISEFLVKYLAAFTTGFIHIMEIKWIFSSLSKLFSDGRK
jgi:hypothetical protein